MFATPHQQARSMYDAGLSYFPDRESQLVYTGQGPSTGLGFIDPVTAVQAASSVVNEFKSLFGQTTDDRQRAARAAFFLQNALQENVAAAQCLLGGQHNTASHERPMYDKAVAALQQTSAGAATYQQALTAGPYWSTSDTAASYPNMQAFVMQWGAAHNTATVTPPAPPAPTQGGTFGMPAPSTPGRYPRAPSAPGAFGASPMALGVGALVVVLLLGNRR